MRVNEMGRGLRLTELGLGTAQLGNLYEPRTEAVAVATVEAAWEGGVRYFDTAPHYGLGLSEARLGRALRGMPRDDYVISTKAGRLLEPSGELAPDVEGFAVTSPLRRRWDFSRDGIRRSLDESLDRLGLDRIDILFLHDPDDHWDEASAVGVAALQELREEGVVRAIGVGMNQAEMLARFVAETDIDVVMVAARLTLLDRGALAALLPLAAERGVDVVAAAVFNSGLLASPVVPEGATFDYRAAPADMIARARRLAAACTAWGVELPSAALRFPLRCAGVRSVVAGTGDPTEMRENLRRLSAHIPEQLWAHLDEALDQVGAQEDAG